MFYERYGRARGFSLKDDEASSWLDSTDSGESDFGETTNPPADASSAKAVLRGATPAEGGAEFEIVGSAVIGRFDPNVGPVDVDLGGLSEGSFVSRRHAKIEYRNGQWVLEDLGSSNGTFVRTGEDFERISGPTPLWNGDLIVFGKPQFLFEVAAGEEPVGDEDSGAVEPTGEEQDA
ncbi:MAG: hypothetical protein KatS3mg015_1745 [Fimbriimonadales bacterium]|nr:MAG: hypothetical protein KatS3mg015_1745 [Fimbriimonadales bacterium]